MQVNHGIVVRLHDEVVHFCGFEESIGEKDIELLKQELASDEEFNLSNCLDELVFSIATQEEIDLMNEVLVDLEN